MKKPLPLSPRHTTAAYKDARSLPKHRTKKRKGRTIWKTRDRKGVRHWSERPDYVSGHDIYTGQQCEPPEKGDRVIRIFLVRVISSYV